MKKIILILVMLNITIFAQSEQQSIELPDFVITGKQSIEIQSAQKPKTELISILSKEFFTPKYSSEELPILINSYPKPEIPSIKSSLEYFNGILKIGLGKNTLPIGELNLSQSFDNYLVNAKLWGVNIKDYLPNAGYNNSGFSMSHDLFISTKSSFLPGTKFNVDASYWRDSYKYFASTNPFEKRETDNLNASLSISNNYGSLFNFGLSASGELLKLNENDFKETKINSNGFMEFGWEKFLFGGNINFINQNVRTTNAESSYNYFDSKAYIKFLPIENLQLKAGANFNSNSQFNYFVPFAMAELKIEKNLTLGAEFNPHIEFLTTRNFLDKNRYSRLTLDNDFTKYKNDISASLRYEFQKMFSTSLVVGYSIIDNYSYYEDKTLAGKYDLLLLSDVKKVFAKVNFYLFENEFGNIYADVLLQQVKADNDYYIPYEPKVKSSLSYNYVFNFGVGFTLTYQNAIDSFADIKNNNKLENYHNLSAKVDYELFNTLKLYADFQNILNKSNFVFNNYQEKPFDYLVGVEYRW